MATNVERRLPMGERPDNRWCRICGAPSDTCFAIRVRKGARCVNCGGRPTPAAESSRGGSEVVARDAGRYLGGCGEWAMECMNHIRWI
ncbi:hypothetical protein B0H17DRAFT_1043809 [Mycena rosella]|uniref:Uncharacterized protein n=1 Tax=Mycena rosella TaxID=1033263 RepID=A0AAD7DZ60_MYCRO|nr:hypothetical protein B0H17DRAFT_1043809 [Mycena rosella]